MLNFVNTFIAAYHSVLPKRHPSHIVLSICIIGLVCGGVPGGDCSSGAAVNAHPAGVGGNMTGRQAEIVPGVVATWADATSRKSCSPSSTRKCGECTVGM